jgi:hypothetical protein
MLALLGLHDPVELDGRVVTEVLEPGALATSLHGHDPLIAVLGAIYKQVNAPFGELAKHALVASTHALAGDDTTYAQLEAAIADLDTRRDALAAQIRTALNAAAFDGTPIDPWKAFLWIWQGEALLDEAAQLAHR